MFVPINDNTPLSIIRFQYVTGLIIAANVVIYLFTGGLSGEEANLFWATALGVVPSELLASERHVIAALNPVSEPATLVTYMFLHAGWLHLLSNMAFLWVFADNVEDAFGHLGFTAFYLVCGVVAALAHVAMAPGSHEPLVGASGAVSGVMAAYLLLYPKARVWILLFFKIPMRIPAWVALGAWIALQVVSLFSIAPEGVAVAWWAHIGGFAAGLLMTLLFRRLLNKRQIESRRAQ